MTTQTLSITQQKAIETRARRQAAGRYPTPAQKAAMRRLYLRDGYRNASVEDMRLLASHPHLTASQKAEWAKRADAATVAQ